MEPANAHDAAEMIVKAVEQNRYHVLVGSDAKMIDFMAWLAPKRAAHLIYSRMGSLLKR